MFSTLWLQKIVARTRKVSGQLRPSSDAVLHMSRIKCKWGRTKDFSHLHSIRLIWSTASELGLKQNKTNKSTLEKYRSHDFNNLLFILIKIQTQQRHCITKISLKIWIKAIWYFKYICQLQPFEHYHQISKCCFLVNVYIYSG